MTRREYLYLQFSGIISLLVSACKHEPEIKPESEKPIVLPLKTLEMLSVIPDEAIAGESLNVNFKAENIKKVLVKLINKKGEILESHSLDSTIGFYKFQLPPVFEKDEKITVKVSGDSLVASKKNIPTFNSITINTNDYPELMVKNGIQKVLVSADEVWLKRISDIEIKAFLGKCTHAGCGIDFLKTENHFYCSCHGSKFDADGVVLVGPASLPLNQYQCTYVSADQYKIIY